MGRPRAHSHERAIFVLEIPSPDEVVDARGVEA
jgi:hypothetical protein